MKTILLTLIAFILGFGAVFAYRYIQKPTPKQSITNISEPTPQPTFALVPPSQAVSGMLGTTTGHVEKLSRNVDGYHEASSGAQIFIGESVATKENSTATATIGDIAKITMAQNAELVFANLFPANLVLQQKAGKIDYIVTKPISIRALHTLVSIDTGEITINIIDTDISITAKNGTVKFALVDNDNNTHVWNLKAEQRANIDDTNSQVYLVRVRVQSC